MPGEEGGGGGGQTEIEKQGGGWEDVWVREERGKKAAIREYRRKS